MGNFDKKCFRPGYNDCRNKFATNDLSCMKMILLTQS